ncbi:MAG: hypothetical protein A3K10_08105 [Bacteroidetes bacterium RIFCSPLOWO2_12_FULL_31_6]|nr:MAG: hypothetical protein A3K10_08105 [Bacteroidetes bacterium RIFCSPLOWO2_12_FULL_31_6]
MKKLFTYCFLLIALNSFSQTYFPFPDSIGVWKQTSLYYQPNSTGVIHYSIFMNGDTIINGFLYNKLYIYSCGQNIIPDPYPIPTFNCPIDTSNSFYYGALREVNKRVYFHPDSLYNYSHWYPFCFTSNWSSQPSLNEELLVYDFNVAAGDTLIYPHLDSLKMIITSIDSVLIQSDYRKKYNYNLIYNWSMSCVPFGASYNYVEGIGDNSGLFSLFIMYFENGEYLSCFEDDEVFYSNPNFNGCSLTSLKEYFNNDDLKIYPNPASSNLFIELSDFNDTFNAQLNIFDISGKEVYSLPIIQSTTKIDVSSLKSGLYLLKITSENGNSISKLLSIH